MPLESILKVKLVCGKCCRVCELGDAIPCANGGTGYGCPQFDCGGMMREYTTVTGIPSAGFYRTTR